MVGMGRSWVRGQKGNIFIFVLPLLFYVLMCRHYFYSANKRLSFTRSSSHNYKGIIFIRKIKWFHLYSAIPIQS